MGHRCCIEFLNIQGKSVFDRSIEILDCLIQHEEYKSITNKAVHENVAPLLRCKNGRSYRRRSEVTQRVGDFQFASVRTKKSKHLKPV